VAASEELVVAVTSEELLVAMSEELVATAAVDGNTSGTERLVGTRRVPAPIQKSGLAPQRLKFARIFVNRSFSLT
jgi:hypothetical protein